METYSYENLIAQNMVLNHNSRGSPPELVNDRERAYIRLSELMGIYAVYCSDPSLLYEICMRKISYISSAFTLQELHQILLPSPMIYDSEQSPQAVFPQYYIEAEELLCLFIKSKEDTKGFSLIMQNRLHELVQKYYG